MLSALMANFDTYLFDLDGTLIDSLELILKSYRHTLKTHKGYAPPDEAWITGIGTPLRAQLKPFAEDDVEMEQMVSTFRDHNILYHEKLVRPYPGIRDALTKLKARRVKLGIVTSKIRAGADRGLRQCGLDDLFDVIVAADDLDLHKPDPAPVLMALEKLDASPNHTIFLGDSPFDIEAGRSAGVKTAAVDWGFFERRDLERFDPDYWLSTPEEIALL